jgi:crotonobetainyl-CoA:carnitine CoA-transferase CaiB-like acyl-CoA transferase
LNDVGMVDGALAGLRVLDISTLFAAPQIAAVLGDLGADVVKVEPPHGDPLRSMGAQRDGRSLMWALAARNKRAITLDLDSEGGRDLLQRLVEQTDVLVENYPRSTLERWRCTYDELAARNRRLVVVSVSCYGATGPYRDRPGAGTLAEAFGGLTNMIGEADGPPMLPSVALGDTVTAMTGVIGALAACYYRDTGGGRGQHVDVSMYEPILQLLSGTIVAYDPIGETPKRTGSRVSGGVPRNVYRTRDGHWVVVSGTTDAQVARLLPLIRRDTPQDRARFGRSAARLAVADELDGLVAGWIAARDRKDVLEAFLAARIPAAPVNDVPAILDDPHVSERNSLVKVDDDDLGSLTMPSPTPRLSATPAQVRAIGPRLGAHNDEVFRDWLELGSQEMDALRRAGGV